MLQILYKLLRNKLKLLTLRNTGLYVTIMLPPSYFI
jgi:hypothetical protein